MRIEGDRADDNYSLGVTFIMEVRFKLNINRGSSNRDVWSDRPYVRAVIIASMGTSISIREKCTNLQMV